MKSLTNRDQSTFHYVVFIVLSLFFTLRSFAQPANDACGSATSLTPGTTCVNIAGGLRHPTTGVASTPTVGINTFCGNAASPDVWYSFVASSAYPVITISSLGSNLRVAPRLQLFGTTSCLFTTLNSNSLACASGTNVTSLVLNTFTSPGGAGLTVGQTYLLRVFTNGNSVSSGTAATWNFNICITDPPTNDLCTNATPLTVGTSCASPTSGTLTNANYSALISACSGSGGGDKDVWYSFVANAPNPTITLGSAPAQKSIQIFSGTCGALTSLQCAINNANLNATGLTPGNTYYVRIWSDNNSTGTFTICVTDPAPANNLCAGAVTLTSSTVCSPITGNMYPATVTSPTTIAVPDCSGGLATYDVWYKFVAQTPNPTVTISNLGATFAPDVHMQLLSNNCGGTFTNYYCGTTSIAANYLTPGNTYFIRVYGTGTVPTTYTGNNFDICVTDPVSLPPSNDECTGAVNLSINPSCSNAPGNMAGATPSAIPLNMSCPGPLVYDVWFKFVAVGPNATVTTSGFGTNFLATRGVEIFSGACGALTSIVCAATTATATTLTAGSTYYVRIYSTTPPIPNGNARFNICVTSTDLPSVRFGNSYVNITKKTTGGVVEPGDTLEIRMTINHTSGTIYRPRYVDNIPTHTSMITGAKNFMGVITNEGLVYRQFTLAGADDAGTYLASPPSGQYNIRMNLAFGGSLPGIPVNNTSTESASASNASIVAASDRPRGGGGMLFATAFRVVASGTFGDTISLNAGQFIYQTTNGGPDVTLTSTPYKILITKPLNLCSNSIGINNAGENGGTFGSGNTLTRSTDLTTPISGYSFINDVTLYNTVGDGRYSIVKNLSPINGTMVNARRQSQCDVPTALAFDDPMNCNNRMYGHWDIGGDHTGTNTSTGNAPPSQSTPGGYMLMVNADFVASEIYRQTLNNLCPNTYYEFSAWIRNICPTCGVDSVGQQFTGTVTAPTLGYPGVYPNLSFALNGVDYYSTGEVDVTGWEKRGFVFRTGPTQTSAVFTIRNNAQGGGGNDWALDDIAVATCLPTMSYSPTINPTICQNNVITIRDTISSYFNNYTTYKWQRSTNGGSSWNDITGVTTLPDTNYYITSYTIPYTNATLANNNDRYRVVVATTAANLTDPNCNISDGVTITLTVLNCGIPLSTNLLSFNGKLMNNYAVLSWSTAREDEPVSFELERSADGITFTKITTIAGINNGQAANYYSYTDPQLVMSKNWYRLVMINNKGSKKYSQVIQLNIQSGDFDIENVANPFSSQLMFNVSTNKSAKVNVELINMQGKIVKSNSYLVHAGTNSLRLEDTDVLASGIYTLRIQKEDKIINKKVMKQNN